MILAEATKLYPVFTAHANELRAAACYLVRRMEQYAGRQKGKPDEKFHEMLQRHCQVLRTLADMECAREPFVYLNKADRDLVFRVCNWLKAHPEDRLT